MAKETVKTRTYLIRCWQDSHVAAPHHWRFTVEEVLHDKQRWGFSDLDELVAFLRAELTDVDKNIIKENKTNGSI